MSAAVNRSRPSPDTMERPLAQGGYPHPSMPQQAWGPQRQPSRPTVRDPQPHPELQRQRSRPDQQYQQQQPVLQRQPSRPDQPYQDRRLLQQPQPSRPDQYYPEQPSPAMTDSYQYKALPVQPVAAAFLRTPSAPLPHSDSQSTLVGPSRPHPENILIRGNSDDELDKSDVFWRRFNASAMQQQQSDAEKNSWLQKNEGKSSRYSRRIWIAGLLIVLLAAGGIGVGIFLSSRNNSDNTRPDAIGGADNITSAGAGTTTVVQGTGVGVGDVATTSSLHVSPTNTVA